MLIRFHLYTLLLLVSSCIAAPKGPNTVVHVTKANFDKVLETDKPVIIDVYGTWCNPCKQLKPIYHAFAEQIKFGMFVQRSMQMNQKSLVQGSG